METMVVTTGDDEPERDNGVECLCFRRDFQPYKVSFALGRWLDRHVREFDSFTFTLCFPSVAGQPLLPRKNAGCRT